MDRKLIIQNMERNMFIIKNKLLENVNLRKLLFYSTPDALEKTETSVESVNKQIDLTSVVHYGTDPKNPVNSFITVDLDQSDFADFQEAIHELSVNLFCNQSTLLMNNNRLRHFALAQEIVNSLGGTMLLSAGKMVLTNMELKILNEDYVGFQLDFMAIDSTEVDNF